MSDWFKKTFNDINGEPSFSRQAASVLVVALIVFAAIDKPVGVLYAIGGVISTVLLGTAFKRKE